MRPTVPLPTPEAAGKSVASARAGPGKAVQVDPIKPTLKAPGTQRLKLKYDNPLSSFAFKFNLRRYTQAPEHPRAHSATPSASSRQGSAETACHFLQHICQLSVNDSNAARLVSRALSVGLTVFCETSPA